MLDTIYKHLHTIQSFGHRMFAGEQQTASYIKAILDTQSIQYRTQPYDVFYPQRTKYGLTVDGEKLECLPCGFGSGIITGKKIIDSTIVFDYQDPVLSYNSFCPGLSTPVIYKGPALAITPADVSKVLTAKNIAGYIETKKTLTQSENISVGNHENPEKILICHYDARIGGACDNGSGTATLLGLATSLDLSKYLILFGGSEEVSYDDYDRYRCYGYRQFESQYKRLFDSCREILVFDCFGYKTDILTDDVSILKQGLLLNDCSVLSKTKMYGTMWDELMEIYHSPIDTAEKIKSINLDEIMQIISQ